MADVFTEEQVHEDGVNRVARTGAQVLASQVVTVTDWIAHMAGWHDELPTPVAIALAGLLTVAASWVMNRRRMGGKQ